MQLNTIFIYTKLFSYSCPALLGKGPHCNKHRGTIVSTLIPSYVIIYTQLYTHIYQVMYSHKSSYVISIGSYVLSIPSYVISKPSCIPTKSSCILPYTDLCNHIY